MRQWLGTAHQIGWRPADFWPATLVEFFDCIDAHNEAQQSERDTAAPSQDEMALLIAKFG